MAGRASARDGSGGFILVAVLAVMALLAGVVGAVSLVSRSTVEGARISADRLTADALVRAGMELAAYQLYARNLPAASVNAQQIRLDAGTVTLFVTSEGGKIDLNGADPEVLAGAWEAAGLSGMPADAFAARVADWRDENDEPEDSGAETDAYRAAGIAGPRNGAFRSVDELRHVLGVTPTDIRILSPLLTVHNPAGAVNLFDAPEEVLLVLPGVAAPSVNRLLSIRGNRTKEVADEMTELFADQGDYITTEPGGASHRVRVEARRADGHVTSVEAVLAKGVTDDALYHVVDWAE